MERVNQMVCEMTGVVLDVTATKGWNSPSLDRIIPERGYVYSNVRVVCYAMNCALGTWGEGVLWTMLEAWRKEQKGGASSL